MTLSQHRGVLLLSLPLPLLLFLLCLRFLCGFSRSLFFFLELPLSLLLLQTDLLQSLGLEVNEAERGEVREAPLAIDETPLVGIASAPTNWRVLFVCDETARKGKALGAR